MMHEKALSYEYSKMALGVTLSLHFLLFLGNIIWFYPRSLGYLVSGSWSHKNYFIFEKELKVRWIGTRRGSVGAWRKYNKNIFGFEVVLNNEKHNSNTNKK